MTLVDASGFEVGDGIAVLDDRSGGFHTTVATITGRSGKTFSISKPLGADCMVAQNARAATVFPVVSACDVEGAIIQNLTIDGAKDENAHLNGCRGAGVYFRGETEGMAGHRNRLEKNVIEDNGRDAPSAGIRIDGETRDVVIVGNKIRDSRTAIRIGEKAGEVEIDGNEIEAEVSVDDRRARDER